MASLHGLAGLLAALRPDPKAGRDNAEEAARAREALLEETGSPDPWTSRARPAFLYVMYALLLWSIPMGLIAGVRPALADAIGRGMATYLNAIPEPMWALFGTGYLGYTAARTWGKVKGVE